MTIKVTYIKSELKARYKYLSTLKSGKTIRGLQFDPFGELK